MSWVDICDVSRDNGQILKEKSITFFLEEVGARGIKENEDSLAL
jgi:hypothetical protein